VEHARRRQRSQGLVQAAAQLPLRRASRDRLLAPAYPETVTGEDGRRWGVADVLVPQQGPNYALAKRVQRWRSVVTEADGRVASHDVAPASWTRSVTRNRVLAAAYGGASRFGIEVFDPATTRVLMAALLVHDLQAPAPAGHPEEIFVRSAAHGGLWRAAYAPRTALPLAAVVGLPATLLRR
jgi:hypothetical protein